MRVAYIDWNDLVSHGVNPGNHSRVGGFAAVLALVSEGSASQPPTQTAVDIKAVGWPVGQGSSLEDQDS